MKRLLISLAAIFIFSLVNGQNGPTIIETDPTYVEPGNTIIDPTVTNNIIDKAFTGQTGIVFVILVGIIAFLLYMNYRREKAKEAADERVIEMAIKSNQVMEAQKNAYEHLDDKLDQIKTDTQKILEKLFGHA